MNRSSRKQNLSGYRAQAIVEFAIAMPILMVLLVGIFEVGRMVFIYSAVTNASREAARYASAVGTDDDGLNHYNNCDGIRNMAKRAAYFMNLQNGDIEITYDDGPGTTVRNPVCDGSDKVSTGERVIVEITGSYSPMIKLIPLGTHTFVSSSARTVLGIFDLDS